MWLPLRRLGFLAIRLFDKPAPGLGHEATLQLIKLGEQLGFGSTWVRHRQRATSSYSPISR